VHRVPALAEGQFEAAISTADVILQHYPDLAYLLVKRGSAYGSPLRSELAGEYTQASDIPPDVKAKADRWYQENLSAFAQVEALGWRPQDGQRRNGGIQLRSRRLGLSRFLASCERFLIYVSRSHIFVVGVTNWLR